MSRQMSRAQQAEALDDLRALSRYWWLWLIMGAAWILISLIILQLDESSVTTIGVIIGVMFIASGVQQFVMAGVAEGWKWLWIIFGAVFIIAGIVALAYPTRTFAAVADMLGFLFFIVGVFWLIEAFMTREGNELWWLGLLSGILMVVLAFWTAGQFFITRAYMLLVFAGIWALMHGILDIVKAFQIKKLGKLPTLAV